MYFRDRSILDNWARTSHMLRQYVVLSNSTDPYQRERVLSLIMELLGEKGRDLNTPLLLKTIKELSKDDYKEQIAASLDLSQCLELERNSVLDWILATRTIGEFNLRDFFRLYN